jgi:hypothetical protein
LVRLLMTLTLASCAFVLSFDALRSLAVTLGLPSTIAWLWPCAIDLAIGQATMCLLSLGRRSALLDTNGGTIQYQAGVAETRSSRTPNCSLPPNGTPRI